MDNKMTDKSKRVVHIEYNRMNNRDFHALAEVLVNAGVIRAGIRDGEPVLIYDDVNNTRISAVRADITDFTFASVTRVRISKEREKTDKTRYSFFNHQTVAEKFYKPHHYNHGKTDVFRYEVDAWRPNNPI
jgi:hypothetical protein